MANAFSGAASGLNIRGLVQDLERIQTAPLRNQMIQDQAAASKAQQERLAQYQASVLSARQGLDGAKQSPLFKGVVGESDLTIDDNALGKWKSFQEAQRLDGALSQMIASQGDKVDPDFANVVRQKIMNGNIKGGAASLEKLTNMLDPLEASRRELEAESIEGGLSALESKELKTQDDLELQALFARRDLGKIEEHFMSRGSVASPADQARFFTLQSSAIKGDAFASEVKLDNAARTLQDSFNDSVIAGKGTPRSRLNQMNGALQVYQDWLAKAPLSSKQRSKYQAEFDDMRGTFESKEKTLKAEEENFNLMRATLGRLDLPSDAFDGSDEKLAKTIEASSLVKGGVKDVGALIQHAIENKGIISQRRASDDVTRKMNTEQVSSLRESFNTVAGVKPSASTILNALTIPDSAPMQSPQLAPISGSKGVFVGPDKKRYFTIQDPEGDGIILVTPDLDSPSGLSIKRTSILPGDSRTSPNTISLEGAEDLSIDGLIESSVDVKGPAAAGGAFAKSVAGAVNSSIASAFKRSARRVKAGAPSQGFRIKTSNIPEAEARDLARDASRLANKASNLSTYERIFGEESPELRLGEGRSLLREAMQLYLKASTSLYLDPFGPDTPSL